jgi:hypothetical protein
MNNDGSFKCIVELVAKMSVEMLVSKLVHDFL